MSRFVRHLLCTAVAGAMLTASAGAQLVPGVSLPPISLPMPAPVGNVPVSAKVGTSAEPQTAGTVIV